MPSVRFLRDFDYDVPGKGGRVTRAYKAGTVDTVTAAVAEKLIASGAAESAEPEKERKARATDGK
jgi:hypothetical protein